MNRLARLLVLAAALMLGLLLAWSMLQLPPPALQLGQQVDARLGVSGVKHPVTAVLLNFRGYDTLLEIAVLLLALLGVLSTGGTRPDSGKLSMGAPQTILQMTVRILTPVMVLVAGYLLWAGAFQPGGAFQAGAVLAAAGVLLNLSGLLPVRRCVGRWQRMMLMGGFLLFLSIAALALVEGALLQYPLPWAGTLILAIEAGLTLSLGLLLAGLFLWLPSQHPEQEA